MSINDPVHPESAPDNPPPRPPLPREAAPYGLPPQGGPYRREGGAPPRRPQKRPSRVLPILLGLLVLLGVGVFAVISIGGFLLNMVGGSGAAGIQDFHLRSSPIALLRINDTIMPGASFNFWMESLNTIAKDSKIRGLVLRIDSPGGAVGSSQELFDQVLKIRQGGKKVFVSMGDVAASGGYYIASAADRVFANRGTLTGSVGVIMTNYRLEGLAEKAGVKVEVVKTGRFKDAGSMFRPMSDDDKKMFDLLINDAYEQFIDDILLQREPALAEALAKFEDTQWQHFLFTKPANPTPRKFLSEIADGRVYSGEQALKLGLIDELGSLNRVVERMATDLGVSAETAVYEPRRRVSFFDMLNSKFTGPIPSGMLSQPSLQYRMIPY